MTETPKLTTLGIAALLMVTTFKNDFSHPYAQSGSAAAEMASPGCKKMSSMKYKMDTSSEYMQRSFVGDGDYEARPRIKYT